MRRGISSALFLLAWSADGVRQKRDEEETDCPSFTDTVTVRFSEIRERGEKKNVTTFMFVGGFLFKMGQIVMNLRLRLSEVTSSCCTVAAVSSASVGASGPPAHWSHLLAQLSRDLKPEHDWELGGGATGSSGRETGERLRPSLRRVCIWSRFLIPTE